MKLTDNEINEISYNMFRVFSIPVILIGSCIMCSRYMDKQEEKEPKVYKSDWAKPLDPSIPAEYVRYFNPETGEIRYLEYGPENPANILPQPNGGKVTIKSGDVEIDLSLSKEELLDQVMDELDFWDYFEYHNGN